MTIDEFEDMYSRIHELDFSTQSELGKTLFPDYWVGHLLEVDWDLLTYDKHLPGFRLCDEVCEWCAETGVTVKYEVLPVLLLIRPNGFDGQVLASVLRFETASQMVHYKLRWLDN